LGWTDKARKKKKRGFGNGTRVIHPSSFGERREKKQFPEGATG